MTEDAIHARAGTIFGAAGLILGYLGVAISVPWWPFAHDRVDPAPTCSFPSPSGAADDAGRLRPPEDLTISWEQSSTVAGRVSATIHWRNADPRTTEGLLDVTGRYGSRGAGDMAHFLDGRGIPVSGLCGHWLRQYSSSTDGSRGVFFDGLWAGEPYCFAVNSSDEDGGNAPPYPSINVGPICEKAPWNGKWGKAAGPTPTSP